MTTTTIRLPEALKARVAAMAEQQGTTPHNFILQAIAEKAEQDERRHEFDALAEARYARIATTGESIAWKDIRAYLKAHAGGAESPPPRARKLAK